MDLTALRSNGRLVGFDAESKSVMHVTVGARALLLNETDHGSVVEQIRYDLI